MYTCIELWCHVHFKGENIYGWTKYCVCKLVLLKSHWE